MHGNTSPSPTGYFVDKVLVWADQGGVEKHRAVLRRLLETGRRSRELGLVSWPGGFHAIGAFMQVSFLVVSDA
jgi:hypothetical protein